MDASQKLDEPNVAYTEKLQSINVQTGLPECIQSLSPDELRKLERGLVRKVDARLMPAVIVMYLLNYIDRTNIASARLGGLEEDLDLKGSQYQTCEYIFHDLLGVERNGEKTSDNSKRCFHSLRRVHPHASS